MSVERLDDHRSRRREPGSRVPPSNLAAEESLLGGMLLSADAIAAGAETCHPEYFYKPAHGHIFDAILTLYSQGEPADPITVADQLARVGLLEAIGGPAVLTTLQANTPSISNAATYAAIVEDYALLRQLIGVGGEIAELGYEAGDDVEDALDRAENLVFQIADRRAPESLYGIDQVLTSVVDGIERRCERRAGGDEGLSGVPTGFVDLDERLDGLQSGQLVIVGARPAMGKTSFAMSIAANAAIRHRVPTLVVSLEMSREEVGTRLVSAEARVDSTHIRNGRLTENDWPKINGVLGSIAEAPLLIDDAADTTVMEIRAKARRVRSKMGGLGLIVVDYLQLLHGRGNADNRTVEVGQFSRGLKVLARDLGCPVVALCQLSRNLEYRADKRPMMADLRESGAIEGDADVVLFIYRDEIYNPESPDRGSAEIIIGKNRNGPIGSTSLAFLDRCTRFVDMARI